MPAHDYRQSSAFYSDVTLTTVNYLTEQGFLSEIAKAVAKNTCDMILLTFGGEYLYVRAIKKNIAKATCSKLLSEKEFSKLFIESVKNTLIKNHFNEQISNDTATQLYAAIQDLFGGTAIYIPKEEKKLARLRDAEIVSEFNGRNVTELARKYNFSIGHIYRILKTARDNKNTKEVLS